jgi:Domain of unknown function (DUF4157)
MAGGPDRRQATKGTRKPGAPVQAEPEPDEIARVNLPLAGLALPVRPSLRVGAVNDPAELEAESVAELVVDALRRSPEPGLEPVPGTPVPGTPVPGTPAPGTPVPGTHFEPAEVGPVRRAPVVGAAGGEVDESASAAVEQLRGGGQPLPGGIRRSMESAFGADLSGVRVHTGPTAARLNDQLGAHAFTAGNDIVFAEGLPDVRQPDGQRLMAHELTHVLQHRGADTLSALRRQAATVARPARHAAPESTESDQVRLDTVTFTVRPAQHADSDSAAAIVRRVFDVAVSPKMGEGDVVCIGSVVISNRPKNPDTTGMTEHGGKSFHHESAWTWVEKQVTQFEGAPLGEVVGHLVKYGLDPTIPKLADPGADAMKQMIALNGYFHDFLVTKAKEAEGWLGPKGTHSSQGGKISGAIKSLQSSGWTPTNIFKALTVSFEPAPDVTDEALWRAAQAHADAFYAANQQLLEKEGPTATVDLDAHAEILEIIKDWDTQYWKPEYDEMEVEK